MLGRAKLKILIMEKIMRKLLFSFMTAILLMGAVSSLASEPIDVATCNKKMKPDTYPEPCAGSGGNCCWKN